MKRFTVLFFFFGIQLLAAQFLDKKEQLRSYEGFFNFHYSETEGEIYLEVPADKINSEFLYVHSLRTGVGSNDIGLDRGQLGGGVVVSFLKSGNKLLLVQKNLNFRAESNNELERKSIEEAFATSVLFGFDIKETKGTTYIIDFTPFLLLDAHGVATKLKKQKEGTYKLDKTRNTLWMERTKSFPKNSEFEAMLTFTGEPTGKNLRKVSPDASVITVIQHHSFVALPDKKYTPRVFQPGCGAFPLTFMDYSTPIWEPITKRFITRHRLTKKHPEAAQSEAVEPIIYYLDPGTPEPVRSALLEGALWWNEAFEAIGYTNAFQVKMLPPDADPMDVRYNTIQWVHRSTRGWSYGSSVTDPRTGEIIKGHVSLGSLRIRQDFMIAQALMNQPFKNNNANYQPMLEMALARIRQLAAHEVGHTLGFAHNFAASATNNASVMDYPHPFLKLENGTIDFSKAYDSGIGTWDKVTVAYSYADFSKTMSEAVALQKIIENAAAEGHRFISDSDARSQGGAHSTAHLWDNGSNASVALKTTLEIRKTAINNFSVDNIRTGDPYSVLEDVFVPLYFYHRFQTEAAVKLIGGIEYRYGVKGDEMFIQRILSKKDQMQALKNVLETLSPEALAIPKEILELFPPRAYGYQRTRESFKSKTGVSFDALGAAATAGDMTIALLLNPERCNRLVQQKALDPRNLGLEEMLTEIIKTVFLESKQSAYENEITQTLQFITVQQVIGLISSEKSTHQTKALANQILNNLLKKYMNSTNAYSEEIIRMIEEYRAQPEKFEKIKPPKIPDGSPIGSFQCFVSQ
ncbi:zinc-dependent metalloprotease [Cochleicola gelatinilyticus]|uniref:Peptidase n=1 Tax=Cochleicola gelatinilyticus TaxID=1763537 RepID=A0A167HTC4_9FLAO|nr:zinc-dependent metalloprotease [Cochleicola gelatinilyticus]OAB78944.1 peptidase [Cochleicola gelatinilyticus]